MGEATLVLADGQAILIDALGSVLAAHGRPVTASATTRRQLCEVVAAVSPELCVTESRFGDGALTEVMDTLLAGAPRTRVVVLTADADPDTLRRCLDSGVSGFVQKSRSVDVLLAALRRVQQGELVVEASFSRASGAAAVASVQPRRLAAYLTQREHECLALVVEGLGTAAIAQRLGVSHTTVRTHVQGMMSKLGVHSRLEAAALAMRHGLVAATGPGSGPGSPGFGSSGSVGAGAAGTLVGAAARSSAAAGRVR